MRKRAPGLLALLVAAGLCTAGTAAAQPFGAIDTPFAGQTVSGIVRVSGWLLNSDPVDRIELLVDGNVVNRADTNIPRADVLEIFPNYANGPTRNPGFLSSFFGRNFSNGPHTVGLRVTQSDGNVFNLPPITVIVDNSVNQAPIGYIDIPGEGAIEGANGSFPVAGWALDDEDVDHIDFLVDGQIVAGAVGRGMPSTAVYGTSRPDIRAAFPNVPNSLFSGFIANIDTTRFHNGMHVFSVRVTDIRGLSRVIGSRNVQIINNGSNLPPFGRIDFPLDKASLLCFGEFVAPPPQDDVCPSPCPGPGPPPPSVPTLIPNYLNGWALDVGARLDRGQVSYVELLLDGVIVANTRRDCVQIGQSLQNCYGLNRPDVARSFPGYVNADNAGFNFVFSFVKIAGSGLLGIVVPAPQGFVTRGFTVPGKHTLAVRVGDEESTVTEIGAMSVDILCDQTTANDRPAFGYIDQPGPYGFINGIFRVAGWAFDYDGIRVTGGIEDGIEIDVDGQVLFRTNNDIFRPDVPAAEPRVSGDPFVGFTYLLDTTRLTDGEHDLVVYVVDAFGRRSEIGRRKFVSDNSNVTRQ